jgi:hypothetical protein
MSEAEPSREAVAMRRTLLKVYRSLYACAWLSAYAVVAVAMARAYLFGANPYADGGYGDMQVVLAVDAMVKLAFGCAVTALFAFAARRTRQLHESLTRSALVPGGELKAWDDFWRLNPFDHAAFGKPWQVDTDRTARIQLNLRIIASFGCLVKAGQLMLCVYLTQNHGAAILSSPTALLEATYLIGMEAYAVFAFGSLWLASNHLSTAPQPNVAFRRHQWLALDRLGNFLVALALYWGTTQAIALYRLCTNLWS